MLPFNHNDNCTGSVCFCDDYNKQIEHLHNNSITEEIKRLKAENARYREALFRIMVTINDPKSILYQLSCEALGLDEPDEVYDYDGP